MNAPRPKVQHALIKPEEGLARGLQKVDETLELLDKAMKQPIPLQADKLKSELRLYVSQLVEFLEFNILQFAQGETGLRTDPTGLLTGRSNYSSASMLKKYKCAYLVDEYAIEIVAENLKKKPSADCHISTLAVAKAVSDDSPVVDIELTDGSHILVDKVNNNLGAVSQDTGKVTWLKSKYDLARDGVKAMMSWLWDMCVRIKEWCIKMYNKGVDWWHEEEQKEDKETVTPAPETTTA